MIDMAHLAQRKQPNRAAGVAISFSAAAAVVVVLSYDIPLYRKVSQVFSVLFLYRCSSADVFQRSVCLKVLDTIDVEKEDLGCADLSRLRTGRRKSHSMQLTLPSTHCSRA